MDTPVFNAVPLSLDFDASDAKVPAESPGLGPGVGPGSLVKATAPLESLESLELLETAPFVPVAQGVLKLLGRFGKFRRSLAQRIAEAAAPLPGQ